MTKSDLGIRGNPQTRVASDPANKNVGIAVSGEDASNKPWEACGVMQSGE